MPFILFTPNSLIFHGKFLSLYLMSCFLCPIDHGYLTALHLKYICDLVVFMSSKSYHSVIFLAFLHIICWQGCYIRLQKNNSNSSVIERPDKYGSSILSNWGMLDARRASVGAVLVLIEIYLLLHNTPI